MSKLDTMTDDDLDLLVAEHANMESYIRRHLVASCPAYDFDCGRTPHCNECLQVDRWVNNIKKVGKS